MIALSETQTSQPAKRKKSKEKTKILNQNLKTKLKQFKQLYQTNMLIPNHRKRAHIPLRTGKSL